MSAADVTHGRPLDALALRVAAEEEAENNREADLQYFYENILPAEGIRTLFTLPDRRHHQVNTVAEAVAKTIELSNVPGVQAVYHACASFKEPTVTDDSGKKRFRVQTNAHNLKTFWTDVDCSREKAAAGDGYETKSLGWKAVQHFIRDNNLPNPMLVIDSGHGLHIYWALTEEVDAKTWMATATKLDALFKAAKFLADPSRTKDSASVLRPPCTMNCKDPANPKPVTIKFRGGLIEFNKFDVAVSTALGNLGVAEPPLFESAVPDYMTSGIDNSDLGVAAEFPLSDANLVANRCQQIGRFRATGFDGNEPAWRLSIGVVAHCIDGAEKVHEWSANSPRYDRQETQNKLDNWSTGPSTCARFNELNADGCVGCTQTCKSPVQLGVKPNVDGAVVVHPIVARFNKKHFVAPAGSSVYVYCETEGKSPQPMQKAAFFDLYANDFFSAGEDKPQNSASYWFRNKFRRQYLGGVTFDPSMKAGADQYNLFSGYAAQPLAGDCEPILNHIQQVICAGDLEYAAFVINWIAQMFLFPGVQPVTALVFQSGEGTGKTILTDMLQDMLGRYWYKAASTQALVTQFNSFLQDCILVVGEEAVWGGDAGKAGILRDLITTKQLRIEIKNGPTYSAESFLHFIFLANDQWAVPAGHDARRWAVFRVSECKKGDSAYFSKLAAWTSDKANQDAFLHYLLSRDISKFNSRHAPMTEGLLQQKLLSLCDIGQFLYHSLMRGSLSDHSADWPATVICSTFIDAVARTVANKHDIKRIETRAGILLKEIFRDGLRKGRETTNGSRRYVWHFPPLDAARAAFSRWMSQPIVWDAE